MYARRNGLPLMFTPLYGSRAVCCGPHALRPDLLLCWTKTCTACILLCLCAAEHPLRLSGTVGLVLKSRIANVVHSPGRDSKGGMRLIGNQVAWQESVRSCRRTVIDTVFLRSAVYTMGVYKVSRNT